MKLFFFLSILLLACQHQGAAPPANGPTSPDGGTRDAAPTPPPPAVVSQCEAAEANLKRLDCRPETTPRAGADSFAKVCEHELTAQFARLDVGCLTRAKSIDEVRNTCGPAVQCKDSGKK